MPFAVGPQPNFLPALIGIGKSLLGGLAASKVGEKVAERFGGGRQVITAQGTAGVPAPQVPPVSTAGLGGLVRLPGAVGAGSSVARRVGQVITGGTIAAGVGGLFTGGEASGGQIKPILDKARAATGVPVTSKKIAAHIRSFGFEASSEFFGLSLEELSIIWMHVSRRRRKRFTTKDKARARSYIRHLQAQERELNKLRPRAKRRTYRRRSTGQQIIKQ